MEKAEADQMDLTAFLESAADRGRTMLLPALIHVQRNNGYISKNHAKAIGKALRVPLAEVTGVIEFYSMLANQPRPKDQIGICTSPVCAAKGAGSIFEAIASEVEDQYQGEYFVEEVPCLGLCDHAPAALVGERQAGEISLDNIFERNNEAPSAFYGDRKVITRWCEPQTSPSLADYTERGGFEGLKKAVLLSPEELIELIKASGLKGRGGAGFPSGIKWEGAFQAAGSPKYIVCNMDESEPGTFKDRALLLGDPFAILEGMLVAAYAVGAEYGYVYIRGEYPQSQHIMEDVIRQADKAGYLGENILGSRLNFSLEVRSGAGAYICGEETALFESIEGKRGFPRIKPPFPTTHGLFGKPTVINNVETLANVPLIVNIGVDAYREMGSEAAPGPRLFSVSGDVVQQGVYEITRPVSLRELVYDFAGGLPDGRSLQGILLGGAAGKFVGEEGLDLELSEEALREAGLALGSGAVMVFDDSRDMRVVLSSLGEFFAHESCGKCYPCQLGTQRQAEILDRNLNGGLLPGDVARLQDVGWTMTDASLCGLGQTAGLAVLSAIELWPQLFIEKDN